MEKTKKSIYMLLIGLVLLVVGAGMQTVSAAQIGEGITLMGYPITTVFLGLGIIALIIAFFFWQFTKIKTIHGPFAIIGILLLVIGLVMFADMPATTTDTTDSDCSILSGWDITGVDTATGGVWADIDADWDSTSNPSIISVPVNLGTTNQSLDQTKFRVNFTIDPIGTTGAPTDKLLTLHLKTEYKMQYGGEDILEKDGSDYIANWTNNDGTEKDYQIDVELTHDEVGWAYCDFQLDSGNDTWAEEFDGAIGETTHWTITAWDDCGWSDTYTVNVVKITDD